MKPFLCAWWGVVVVLFAALQCHARPSLDSDSESWRPLVSGHRINRYTDTPGSIVSLRESVQQTFPISARIPGLRLRDCFDKLKYEIIDGLSNRLSCIKSTLINLSNKTNLNEETVLNSSEIRLLKNKFYVKVPFNVNELKGVKHLFSLNHNIYLSRPKKNLAVENKKVKGYHGPGSLNDKRKRRSVRPSRRVKIKSSGVKVQVHEEVNTKWVPVSLSPPKKHDDFDKKTNIITNDLVHKFVSNSLSDLNFPQENSGSLAQIGAPIFNKEPSDSKWESVSLDDLILSHTPDPEHYPKPTTWHKKPTIILVQDTPDDLLPKPPSYNQHQDPTPEPQVLSPPLETFPRPTYHLPIPSPEPPLKPKPTYYYPSPQPVHYYKPVTFNPPHNQPTHLPHHPYTSVIIQTSTSDYSSEPPSEPAADPTWSSHNPFTDTELEDPYPEPEVIVGDNLPDPEPSPEPPHLHNSPNRPTPPIYIIASQGTPLNPVTVPSGKPPSILILSSPDDTSASSPPQADPYPGEGGGPGGGGLVPVIPPIIPPIASIAGEGVGGVGGGGAGSECAPIQLFNVQTITNSLENKDCIINLNSHVHNINGDSQIEPPTIQADLPLDDIPDSSTISMTTKRPSTGSMTFLDQISSFFTSLTIFNPISLSFWSFLFAPMSILLASGLGVAALVLPWLFPSYWFGRSSNINKRVDHNPYYRFTEPTLRFERSLKSGMDLREFLKQIGML